MFEEKEDVAQAVEALYSVVAKLNRGDILGHDVIASILGLSPHEGRWDHVVGKVRKRLLKERKIETWPEHEVGYKLLTVQEQLEYVPLERSRRAIRQVRKGRKPLDALPASSLTVNQRKLREMLSSGMMSTEKAMRRELRKQGSLISPTPVIPRRRVPGQDG
jgi:hypothetical protein